jgi:uncharacterized protein YggE
MIKIGAAAFAGLILTFPALADAVTPLHTIAVSGDAELLIPPDFAKVELGVITQAPSVGDALAENSARMSRVIDAMKALGISEKDIRTSAFVIQPKYEKMASGEYDAEQFRTITGYYISNKVSVTVKDLSNVAKIIDESVKAGANASGAIEFGVNSVTTRVDEARRKAVETAYHRAQVLTEAAHMKLGTALSITDNQAETSYDNGTRGYTNQYGYETVVVTGSRVPTPIEPGLISITAKVTVVYATR